MYPVRILVQRRRFWIGKYKIHLIWGMLYILLLFFLNPSKKCQLYQAV